MQRSEAIGLGIALVGHAVLFGLLSVGFLATPNPDKLKPTPIDVSLVDDVGLVAQAPQAVVPPAQSAAPDKGEPEDAAPAAPAKEKATPDPTPPVKQPEAAPPPKPAPKAPPKPKKTAAPAPEKTKTPPKREAAPATKTAATAKGTGNNAASKRALARGRSELDDIMKGISDKPSKTKSVVPQAAKMDQKAMMNIASAIIRQVQPCADRQVKPGPGAERIRVTIRLRLNRDGSLAGNPQVIGHDGVDGENSRYQDRVDDNAIATFKGCSPLRGLPAELYDVQDGWSDFKLRYKLPG